MITMLGKSTLAVTLVPAKNDDKNYLIDLRMLTMVEHLERAGVYLDDNQHTQRVDHDFECFQIIYTGAKRAGAIKLKESEQDIEVIQIQIHPDFQGLGLGSQVLSKLIDNARLKRKNVKLNVLKANRALAMYRRLGFALCSEDEYEYHLRLYI